LNKDIISYLNTEWIIIKIIRLFYEYQYISQSSFVFLIGLFCVVGLETVLTDLLFLESCIVVFFYSFGDVLNFKYSSTYEKSSFNEYSQLDIAGSVDCLFGILFKGILCDSFVSFNLKGSKIQSKTLSYWYPYLINFYLNNLLR